MCKILILENLEYIQRIFLKPSYHQHFHIFWNNRLILPLSYRYFTQLFLISFYVLIITVLIISQTQAISLHYSNAMANTITQWPTENKSITSWYVIQVSYPEVSWGKNGLIKCSSKCANWISWKHLLTDVFLYGKHLAGYTCAV